MSSGAVDAEKEAVEAEKEAEEVCCANCGIAQVDDIKLEECSSCDLVKYCSDRCRENHREQHEEECKKRRAELRDKELFEQPDGTHLGECPICFLPMPLDEDKFSFHSCCCKIVCKGCDYADFQSSGQWRCPFCREPVVIGYEEHDKRVMKRVKVNDPAAFRQMGGRYRFEEDWNTAAEYLKKATEFGDPIACYQLGWMYYIEEGVEKDEEKAIQHWEKAAIGGHPDARHYLGCHEKDNGNIERAMKHFIIAANLGYGKSMQALWKNYSLGNITKENLEATLRTNKAAIDATKSSQRDLAEDYYEFRI